MDITEALRNEDISKTDFFDFVACPEMGDTTRLRSPSDTSYLDTLQELKETNNNHLPSTDGFEHLIWGNNGSSVGDKDGVKLETAIFEDWNKLWGHAVVTTADPTGSGSIGSGGGRSTNTDGAIYTLTVLNGEHPTWFNKPDDVNNPLPQPPMDIESLLSIMAPSGSASTNGFRTDNELSSSSPAFNYSDDNTTEPPLISEADDNNTYQNSLLRSALQGKASFLARYNIKVEADQTSKEEATPQQQQATIVELGPSLKQQKTETLSIESPNGTLQPLFASSGVLPSLFEPQNLDSEPSAHSMDELLLSQLDATYDYEKLRRIEDEVAESVQQYCNTTGSSVELTANGDSSSNPPLYKLPLTPATTTATTTTSSPPVKSKKYSKRSKSNAEKTSSTNGVRKERSLHYCNICSKGFKDKYSVNVHIRTHTGEKPFACTLCGKSFRQKAHLAKHYQTHAQKAALSTSPSHKSSKR